MNLNKLKGLNKSMHLKFTTQNKANRQGYGDALVEIGKRNKKVWVCCADLTDSTKVDKFKKAFPKRFVEIGVAEQNLVTVGAGLAAVGKIPFVSSYAAFCPGRCWEQIRTTICYNDQNVKVIGAHAGVSVGPDGATHQALEDIAIMRALPNMVVINPSDYNQTKKATSAIAKFKGPAYMRFGRTATPLFTTNKTPFKIGKANILKQGSDIVFIATGALVYEALAAALILQEQGINAMVIDNPSIKPLDKHTILKAAKKCSRIITIEEAQIAGGLGSAVAEFLSEIHPTKILRIGMNDQFGESGDPQELLKHFGFTGKGIAKKAKKFLKK
jgi:transketolase